MDTVASCYGANPCRTTTLPYESVREEGDPDPDPDTITVNLSVHPSKPSSFLLGQRQRVTTWSTRLIVVSGGSVASLQNPFLPYNRILQNSASLKCKCTSAFDDR